MLIEERYTNATERHTIGASGLFEPFTDNIKTLFSFYQREYGRCISKVYIDSPDGTAKAIGWVFQKHMKYDDCKDTYLQETWVVLHESKPIVSTEYHYKELQ